MAVSMNQLLYLTFELLLHAAFVADEIRGDLLERARRFFVCLSYSLPLYRRL